MSVVMQKPKKRRLVINCDVNLIAELEKARAELGRIRGERSTYEDVLEVFIEVFKQNPYMFLKPKSGPRIR
jgi:hypothetical protein